jgi:hypothetical protein
MAAFRPVVEADSAIEVAAGVRAALQ